MTLSWCPVTSARVDHDKVVILTFADGTVRTLDLSSLLWGLVFAQLAADQHAFEQLFVDPESGTIAWPNGADIAPEALYHPAPELVVA